MYHAKHKLASYAREEGNEEDNRLYVSEAIEISNAMLLLTNKEFFDKMVKIYIKE